jgi:ABC-type polysaccharide/polyol phosphate export permease
MKSMVYQASAAAPACSTVGSLWRRRDLIGALLGADLKRDHRQTALGYLWWLLDPLLLTLVYAVVVGVILQRGGHHPPFALFLLAGLISWKCISGSLVQAVGALSRSESLISTFAFPKAVIPIATVLLQHMYFLVSIPPLVALVLLYRYVLGADHLQVGVTLLYLPLLVAVQFALALGGALLLSCFGVFLRDLSNVVRYAILIGWYLSPGLYSIADVLPGYQGMASVQWSHLRDAFILNPLAHLLEGYRAVLLYGYAPDPVGLGYTAAVAAALLVAGLGVFRSQERRFIKYL